MLEASQTYFILAAYGVWGVCLTSMICVYLTRRVKIRKKLAKLESEQKKVTRGAT